MESTFAERLMAALEYRQMKPVDLAKKSGLSQALISQYLNGKFEAKNDKIALIADKLNVSELYLAGFSSEIVRSELSAGNKFFCKNIKYLRKVNNLSQDELAKELGYKSFTTIQKWESGLSEPSIDKLVSLSEIFDVSMDELLNQDIKAVKLDKAMRSMPTAAEIKKSFSDNLNFYMSKHNLSNKDVAGIAGVREKKVAQWLSGESDPRLPALQNMAEHFGVTVHELISGTPIKSADDVIKNMLLSEEVSEKIGYDPKSLDDEKLSDMTEAIISVLKLTVK